MWEHHLKTVHTFFSDTASATSTPVIALGNEAVWAVEYTKPHLYYFDSYLT